MVSCNNMATLSLCMCVSLCVSFSTSTVPSRKLFAFLINLKKKRGKGEREKKCWKTTKKKTTVPLVSFVPSKLVRYPTEYKNVQTMVVEKFAHSEMVDVCVHHVWCLILFHQFVSRELENLLNQQFQ